MLPNGERRRNSNSYSPHYAQRNIIYDSIRPDSPKPSTPNTPGTELTQAIPSAAQLPGTDIISSIISDFGIWQLRTTLILFLCKIPASWFMACIIFTAPAVYPGSEFKCDSISSNASEIITADQCYIEQQAEVDGQITIVERQECTRFVYDFDFMSLIMQFDLVCARDIFIAWTQFWHLFGVLVGGIVGTKMMLRFSPRTVYTIGAIVQIGFGVVTGYARDFSLHCAFRCLSAVCCAMMFTSAQAIFTDITGGTYRTAILILYDTFWSIGVIFLPGLSSFFNDWTYIYLGITFPTAILLLLLKWTPESPRWLLKNGNENDISRVEDIIRNAAEINDRMFKIPTDFREQLEALRKTLKSTPAPAGWVELWNGPRAKFIMVGAHIAAAALVVNYMGMLLNLRSFGRDYLVPNTIAMGFSEIIGIFLALHFTLKYTKWKYQWAGAFNIIAGAIGCLGWLFSGNETMNPTLKVTLWMIIATIPKAAVSCAQSMILACMAEMMPPNKKLPFVFSVVTFARIWLLSAPFVNVLKSIDVALSLSAYCAISILAGVCTCLLLTPRVSSPSSTVRTDVIQSNKREQSPLRNTIWTVQDESNISRL